MKTKPKLIAKINEERILQLSNDMSEDIQSGTTAEWRAVAMYFRNLFDKSIADFGEIRTNVSLLCLAEHMKSKTLKALNKWK